MYAGTARADAPVPTMQFEAVTEYGHTLDLRAVAFGLRPAEVEGRLDRVKQDPRLLEEMVGSYQRIHPAAPLLVELRVLIGSYHLKDGRPVDYVEEPLAEWMRK